MSTKRLRQNTILQIVDAMEIESQERLADELQNRGIRVSQSTLSRDIQDLGLAKAGSIYINGSGDVQKSSEHTLRVALREFVTGLDAVEYFLVLKTTVGSAGPVSQAIDDQGWREVAGTIAGDDTILVLCRSVRDLERVRAAIQEFLE
jgi:transcriptional regulator of arginine metabolism